MTCVLVRIRFDRGWIIIRMLSVTKGGRSPTCVTLGQRHRRRTHATIEKLIRRKLSLLELAEYLQNVRGACRIHGISRQAFYDIKNAYEEQGIERLREKNRRKPRGGEEGPGVLPEISQLYTTTQSVKFDTD